MPTKKPVGEPKQTTRERLAHHVRVPAQRLAAFLAVAHHGIQVLVPEEGELAEPGQAALDQAPDQMEIDARVGLPTSPYSSRLRMPTFANSAHSGSS